MAEEYWNHKTTVPNLFDQPDASFNRAVSARSRNTTTLGSQRKPSTSPPSSVAQRSNSVSFTPPVAVQDSKESSSATRHRHSLTTAASMPKTTGHGNETACSWCKSRIEEVNLLTEFEGKLIFCKTSCRYETIKSIARELIYGQTNRMYELKSAESKCMLLDESIKQGTSDSIVRAAVYMSQTSREVFHRELRNRPEAFKHYVLYLKQLGNYEEAADLLDENGNFEEAGMLRMARAPTDLRSEEACNRLLNIYMPDELMGSMVKQKVDLSQLHGELEATCKRYSELASLLQSNPQSPELSNAPAWLSWVPTPKTLFGVPLMSTLLFIIVYDQGLQGKHNVSRVRTIFKVLDRHFAWVCVQAFSLLQMWPALENAIIQKSLLRTDKSTLPPDRVAKYVRMSADSEGSAPVRACISRFLKMMADPEERFSTALNFGDWQVALNTTVQLKDKDRLIQLHRSLDVGSHPWNITKNYLEMPPNKWRTI